MKGRNETETRQETSEILLRKKTEKGNNIK